MRARMKMPLLLGAQMCGRRVIAALLGAIRLHEQLTNLARLGFDRALEARSLGCSRCDRLLPSKMDHRERS